MADGVLTDLPSAVEVDIKEQAETQEESKAEEKGAALKKRRSSAMLS